MANVLLQVEISTDPLARGYAGMTDQQVADSLMALFDRVPLGNPTFAASEVMQRIVKAEFTALPATMQRLVWDTLHLGQINPWGIEADLFVDAFGGGSVTISTLVAWRNTKRISRAAELGLGRVLVAHVTEARP